MNRNPKAIPDDIEARIADLEQSAAPLPDQGFGVMLKVASALRLTIALEELWADPNEDPYTRVAAALEEQRRFLNAMRPVIAHMAPGAATEDTADDTTALFETAWTSYSAETYDASVELIHRRLDVNHFDEAFFRDRDCFDGGCGIGRFALAMAARGARSVTAIDRSQAMLDYAAAQAARRGLSRVEFVAADVTDLSRWPDASFDVVISNGVLHHTVDPLGGLREHFRVTRPGGMLWIYLYGKDSFYWAVYDRLRGLIRGIPYNTLRTCMKDFGIREGLIYTLLDNLCAPIRTYHSVREIEETLAPCGEFTITPLRGVTLIDDTERQLSSPYGSVIYGSEGEVRVAVHRC